jgi:hypothetical protein
MKQFLILFSFCIMVSSSVFGQNSPNAAQSSVLLEGTWVVENKALLPIVDAARPEYMKDSLVFMAGKQFKNGHRHGLQLAMYEFDVAESLLSIINVKTLDGIAYQVVALTKQKLVVMVANHEQTALIELTYNRVAEN